MRTVVRTVLERVNEVLGGNWHDAADLWAILTALRGPDFEDDRLKSETVAIIRREVCPNATRLGVKVAPPHQSIPGPSETVWPDREGSLHFERHIRDAWRAITAEEEVGQHT